MSNLRRDPEANPQGWGNETEAGSALGQGQPNGSSQPKSEGRFEVTFVKFYGNLKLTYGPMGWNHGGIKREKGAAAIC